LTRLEGADEGRRRVPRSSVRQRHPAESRRCGEYGEGREPRTGPSGPGRAVRAKEGSGQRHCRSSPGRGADQSPPTVHWTNQGTFAQSS
jgi:hypothetical protein